MNRKITGLLTAGVLALAGTLILVGYVNAAEARALSGEELVDVLVATEEIKAGTKAEDLAGSVTTEQVPAKVRAEQAVTDLDDLEGKVVTVDLLPGEQLLEGRFGEVAVGGRTLVPDGLLEVTISLDPQRAVGGQIAPGDTVAVLASFGDLGDGQPASHLILHKVVVAAVQVDPSQTVAKDGAEESVQRAPSGNLLVTLALDAPSVERVVFAAEHGTIWLSAEPAEAPVAGTQIVTKAKVFG